MKYKFILCTKNISVLMLAVYLLLFSAFIMAKPVTDAIGQVVFSFGEAYVVNTNGVKQLLEHKTLIYEGDKIVTGDRGKVGLRMVDAAVEKIGANSQLLIIKYQYSSDYPENSIIKMELKKGTLFSKTGRGGKASKDKYRLNTPIAAIGIRGTEYTVFTDQKNTKVNVHSGGIVMSSFNSSCRKQDFTSCGGKNVMELLAEQKEKSLLLKLGQKLPVLISSESPENNQTDSSSIPSDNNKTQKQSLPKVTWGRWGEDASNGISLEEKLANGYELVSKSGDFAIIRRENETLAIPNEGVYHFVPKSYGVIVRNSANDTYQNATIENPTLSINFSQKTFKTDFSLLSGNLKSTVEANGSLDDVGVFTDDGRHVNTKVKGAIAGENVGEAAYTFFHKIDDINSAAGGINWSASEK